MEEDWNREGMGGCKGLYRVKGGGHMEGSQVDCWLTLTHSKFQKLSPWFRVSRLSYHIGVHLLLPVHGCKGGARWRLNRTDKQDRRWTVSICPKQAPLYPWISWSRCHPIHYLSLSFNWRRARSLCFLCMPATDLQGNRCRGGKTTVPNPLCCCCFN